MKKNNANISTSWVIHSDYLNLFFATYLVITAAAV